MAEPKTVLTTSDLAERWGCSIETLARWRSRRVGPDFVRLAHKTIVYRMEDILAYEAKQKMETRDV